jgi:hypothetical protein
MVYVTYNIPDMGLATLFSVRRFFLRVIYITDSLYLFLDYSVVCYGARRLAHSSSANFRLSLDLPERNCRHRWTPYSPRPPASLPLSWSLP